jgi:hypothetical protein
VLLLLRLDVVLLLLRLDVVLLLLRVVVEFIVEPAVLVDPTDIKLFKMGIFLSPIVVVLLTASVKEVIPEFALFKSVDVELTNISDTAFAAPMAEFAIVVVLCNKRLDPKEFIIQLY